MVSEAADLYKKVTKIIGNLRNSVKFVLSSNDETEISAEMEYIQTENRNLISLVTKSTRV